MTSLIRRFNVGVRLLSNWFQKKSKCGKNVGEKRLNIALTCATFADLFGFTIRQHEIFLILKFT